MTIIATLLDRLKTTLDELPDSREPSPRLTYTMQDIGLAAFSVFFLQSPSFLSYQRHVERRYGSSNAQSLFGLSQIPSDNQVRNVMDDVDVQELLPMFRFCFTTFESMPQAQDFRFLEVGGQRKYLAALDGTGHFSSKKLSCSQCCTKTASETGVVSYAHSFLGVSLCRPQSEHVISLEPEFVVPQDGAEKQDCERNAAKRWMERHGDYYGAKGMVVLGDELYACEPICALALEKSLDFIFTCKPTSHKALYGALEKVDVKTETFKDATGKTTTITYRNMMPMTGQKRALQVNWLKVEARTRSGKMDYTNAFVTNIPLTAQNIFEVACAGRARWKVENETFNTLKTKGYNLEHNFGHGKKNLCNLFATLNLLAFCFHTLTDIADEKYRLINALIQSRAEFFEEIRMLTRYMLFTSWDHLFETMLGSFNNLDPPSKKRA